MLMLTASSTASLGEYTATVIGTSGSQKASTTVQVTVYAPAFTLGNYNGVVFIGQGTSSTSSIYVNPEYGFTGSVTLSASGLPSGVMASFSRIS